MQVKDEELTTNTYWVRMPNREVMSEGHRFIVIGGSAGSIEALLMLAQNLPADLTATILIVVHLSANRPSFLPQVLQHRAQLTVTHAVDGAVPQLGHIYVAPPDRHLLVKHGYMRVVQGPKENRARPAIDPLFRTAARAYGERVVAVVLSGALWDGAAGLVEVKAQGGVTIAQDPQEALISSLPQSAITSGAVEHVLPTIQIARFLVELAHSSLLKMEEL